MHFVDLAVDGFPYVFDFIDVEVSDNAIEFTCGNFSLHFWVDIGGERIDERSLQVLPIIFVFVAAIVSAAFDVSLTLFVVLVQTDEVVDDRALEVTADVVAGFEAVHDRHVDVKDND